MVYETNHIYYGAFSPWYILYIIYPGMRADAILVIASTCDIINNEGGKESAKKRFCSKERCIA